jgi:hypothetical protein
VVPIHQYLGAGGSFSPEDLKVIGEAFSAALHKLDLKDRNDPMFEAAARRIIRAAMAGERNIDRLTEIGINGHDS